MHRTNRTIAFFVAILTICSFVYAEAGRTAKLIELNTELIMQPVRRPQLNKSIDGNALRISGVEYNEGFGLHAKCVFSVDVSGCDRFQGLVGIDDESLGSDARVNYIIVGDEKIIQESGLIEDGDKPSKIDVDLSNIKTMTVIINDGYNTIGSDHVDIVDAFFTVTGKDPVIIPEVPLPARWELGSDKSITWDIANDKWLGHSDFIEMSGQWVSVIFSYAVDENRHLTINRRLVWPTLRTIPNDTHASLIHDFKDDVFFKIESEGESILPGVYEKGWYDGILHFKGKTKNGLEITREMTPCMDKKMVVEKVTLRNTSKEIVKLSIEKPEYKYETEEAKGVYGKYVLDVTAKFNNKVTLEPGQKCRLFLGFRGRKENEEPIAIQGQKDFDKREALIKQVSDNLQLECPDKVVTRMFDLAKIRATDSVFATKGGLMFAPGGESYYAAVWGNDNAEYQGPFAPFLGEKNAIEAAMNAYRHFARFMNDEYKPIPSSIIAEGTDIWNGAGDRGDAAMIAYGAARFAMASGDKKTAEELWPLITWCLEYCKRQTTAEGVIASDCDELENRFPAGKANLCTATLNYDALISAAQLANELGEDKSLSPEYLNRAKELRQAIVNYFGATVEGFETWRYYDGNTRLRAWLCIPLVMGIDDRKEGTIKALFSPQLWTTNGLATCAGEITFWDRSTLYALRGVFAIGETDLAMEKLSFYSKQRLLGDHVPYPIEAYPEGNKRHLAAESALYCRVITEGLFGIRPTGLKSFTCTPKLPAGWNEMSLKNIRAFGTSFDIIVKNDNGTIVKIYEKGKEILSKAWDQKSPVEVRLAE